jgi:hypothetical protein
MGGKRLNRGAAARPRRHPTNTVTASLIRVHKAGTQTKRISQKSQATSMAGGRIRKSCHSDQSNPGNIRLSYNCPNRPRFSGTVIGTETPQDRKAKQVAQYFRCIRTVLMFFVDDTGHERLCCETEAPGSAASAPDYESGGQEFESLRARHEINDLAHHDLPEKASG